MGKNPTLPCALAASISSAVPTCSTSSFCEMSEIIMLTSSSRSEKRMKDISLVCTIPRKTLAVPTAVKPPARTAS